MGPLETLHEVEKILHNAVTVLKGWQNSVEEKLWYEGNITVHGYFPEEMQPAPLAIFSFCCIMYKHGIACGGEHAIQKRAICSSRFKIFAILRPRFRDRGISIEAWIEILPSFSRSMGTFIPSCHLKIWQKRRLRMGPKRRQISDIAVELLSWLITRSPLAVSFDSCFL